jgi:hypothetical protein
VNDPRRHHLVPRWYLKRFANDKEQLRVIDIKNQKRYVNNVHSVAVEVGFYDLVSSVGVSLDVEELLSVVESEAAIALREIDDNFSNLTDYNREKLAIFVAVQYLRGADRRDFSAAVTDSLGKAQFVGMSKAAIRESLAKRAGAAPTSEEVDYHAALLRNHDAYTVRTPGAHIRNMVKMMVPTALFFAEQFKWQVRKLPVGVLPTSDSPVSLWRNPNSAPEWMGVGIATCDEVRMPLAPDRMLVMSKDKTVAEGVFPVGRQEVGEICLSAMNSAYRCVFFHPNSPLGTQLDIPAWAPSFSAGEELIGMSEKLRQVNERNE